MTFRGFQILLVVENGANGNLEAFDDEALYIAGGRFKDQLIFLADQVTLL